MSMHPYGVGDANVNGNSNAHGDANRNSYTYGNRDGDGDTITSTGGMVEDTVLRHRRQYHIDCFFPRDVGGYKGS